MTPQQKSGVPDSHKKEQLHAQIDETKSAIAGELRELGQKLSPEHLKEGVKEGVEQLKEGVKDMLQEAKSEAKEVIQEAKEAVVGSIRNAKDHAVESVSETINEVGRSARRAGTATADFVSVNAVPLGLIGLGAGWLMLTMRRQRMLRADAYRYRGYDERRFENYDYDTQNPRNAVRSGWDAAESGYEHAKDEARHLMERGKDRVDDLVERAKESTSELREKAGSALSQASERAGELSHEARERFERAQHSTVQFAQENPLAISALAVAAGVGFGMMLPATNIENRLMGPTRGRLMDEARGLMGEARETAQRATQAAREAVGEVKQSLTSGPSH